MLAYIPYMDPMGNKPSPKNWVRYWFISPKCDDVFNESGINIHRYRTWPFLDVLLSHRGTQFVILYFMGFSQRNHPAMEYLHGYGSPRVRLWMVATLHSPNLGWWKFYQSNGMFTIYDLVQDFLQPSTVDYEVWMDMDGCMEVS